MGQLKPVRPGLTTPCASGALRREVGNYRGKGMALQACRECGAQVSTSAEVCPHCGIRSPTSSNPLAALDGRKDSSEAPRRSRTTRIVRTLLYAVAIIVGGYMALALIWSMNEGTLTALPSCGASGAISDAKNAIENAPIGKTFGVRIIDLRDPREISRNNTEVQCAATVKLNSGVEGAFRYRFYIENGKLFVYAQLPTPDLGSSSQDQPNGCTVSLAQYQKLATGMSYAAARQTLGCEGTEMSRSDAAGYATVMYTWNGSTLGGNMNAMFQNDRLINKSQFGLR